MNIFFGKVSKYFKKNGYGYVSCFFKGKRSKVLFHIKTIQQYDDEIYNKLKNGNIENIYFWYEIVNISEKKVIKLLNSDDPRIRNNIELSEKLKKKWLNIKQIVPVWVTLASKDVFDEVTFNELRENRKSLKKQLVSEQQQINMEKIQREEEEQRKKEQKTIEFEQILKEEEFQQLVNEITPLSKEEKEFQQLVNEIRRLKFTHSYQVSKYIIKHQLGKKYPNISGNLVMQSANKSTSWVYKGAIHPNFYDRLCEELQLSNKNTKSLPGPFISYNDLNIKT